MIDLYELKQLAAFADLGTLSRVAEAFHISTPSVTRAMQHLEESFGVARSPLCRKICLSVCRRSMRLQNVIACALQISTALISCCAQSLASGTHFAVKKCRRPNFWCRRTVRCLTSWSGRPRSRASPRTMASCALAIRGVSTFRWMKKKPMSHSILQKNSRRQSGTCVRSAVLQVYKNL